MSNHESKKQLEKGHHRAKAIEGGKCFTRHEDELKESNSCSHRWQAWTNAKEDDSFYNGYSDTDLQKVFKTDPPKRPDWDVPAAFPKSAALPYGHNAHHIIPNGVLLKSLNAAADSTEKPGRARMLIKGGLQMAEYNLNHKRNMIILPTRHRTGWVLKLPVHTEKDHFHHDAYSRAVEQEVNKVMAMYVDEIKSELKKHKATPKKLAKAQLEKQSDRFRAAIKGWGALRHKLYLDKIPSTHYKKY